MKNVCRFTILIAIAVAVLTNQAFAIQGVSPGQADRLVVVESRCPTFSWQEDGASKLYEIVAYSLHSDGNPAAVELTAEAEVLFTQVPAGATSWTPSAEQCFAPGGRYVWFVRAVTEMVDDQVIEAGEWSAGRYFTMPAGPTPDELARAFDVLKRWEAANGNGSLFAAADAGPGSVAVPAAASGTGTGTAGHRKSVPTATAAVRGEHPGTAGEVYGLVGTSASEDGAGVAAANLDGGPDLVLDGSVDGMADARMWEWGVDRVGPTDQTFAFLNSGAGEIQVDVVGKLAAKMVDAEELKVNGSTVIDPTGAWVGTGDMLPCPGCVLSSDIADGGVDSDDLASASVTSAKIATGAVGSIAIRANAIGNVHMASDSVTGAEILDGTIAAVDVDSSGGIYVSKTQVYERVVSSMATFPNATVTVEVSCDDATDLPLAGSCSLTTGSHLELVSTRARDWDDSAFSSEWECMFKNVIGDGSSGAHTTGHARILCISVP